MFYKHHALRSRLTAAACFWKIFLMITVNMKMIFNDMKHTRILSNGWESKRLPRVKNPLVSISSYAVSCKNMSEQSRCRLQVRHVFQECLTLAEHEAQKGDQNNTKHKGAFFDWRGRSTCLLLYRLWGGAIPSGTKQNFLISWASVWTIVAYYHYSMTVSLLPHVSHSWSLSETIAKECGSRCQKCQQHVFWICYLLIMELRRKNIPNCGANLYVC